MFQKSKKNELNPQFVCLTDLVKESPVTREIPDLSPTVREKAT